MQWITRHRLLVASVAAGIAAYALLGFLLVPKLARDYITDYVQNTLQRRVSIGELAFNPFTLTADVRQFELTEADATPIASFDALRVNAQITSAFIAGAIFKEIRIERPQIFVRLNEDGSLNLAKLAPPADPEPEPEAEEEEELPRIRVGTLAVLGGQVRVEDRTRPRPFVATLAPIEFSLANFRTEPKYGNDYRFAASTSNGESLDWAGEFTVQPLGSVGRFTLTDIRAQTIAAYLQDALPFHLPSGLLNVQGQYRLAIADRVDLNITLPVVQARDVALAPLGAEEPTPWVVVPQLAIADVVVAIPDRTLNVGKIQVVDAAVTAWRDVDGSINLAQLLGDNASSQEAPTQDVPAQQAAPPTSANSAWTIGIKSVSIERGRVELADKSIQPNAAIVIAPLNVTVSDYSSAENSAMTIDSTVGFDGKGEVRVGGKLIATPFSTDLKVAVGALELSLAQAYIAQATDMTLLSGALTADAAIAYQSTPPTNKPRLSIVGDLEVVNLLTKDNALQQDFVKWQSLRVTGANFQLEPDRLRIARIQARKPYGRVIISENSNVNVAQILNPLRARAPAPESEPSPAATPPRMPIRIDSIVVEDGSATFADFSVAPSFASEIGSLQGSVTGLSSAKDSRAKVKLAGSVDRYAPVSIEGELNVLATDVYSDIAMTFRNIELTTFNPYSGKFAGYNISKGKLTTEMKYKVENRALNASHNIVIDQLEFGDATDSKDAVSLPIKFAVALLKDRHGVIKLDLPVAGNLDDPTFRVGPIIWQVLKNTLEKIVAAPFTLIASLFGGGDELSYVDFAPGSAALAPSEADKLNKLRMGMVERPQLKLDVPLQAAASADSEALAKAAFEQSVTAATKPNLDRAAVLAAAYTQAFGKPPVYPASTDPNVDVATVRTQYLEGELLTKFTPTAAHLDELARNRGNAVRDVLLSSGEVQADRVFLTGREVALSPTGSVRLELKLE